MRKLLLASLFALAPACVKVSADVPQICASQSVHVAGSASGIAAASPATVTQNLDLGSVNLSMLSRLTLAGGGVTGGASGLAFIDALTVVLEPASSADQEVMLLSYQRGAGAAPAEIAIAATERNLLPYFTAAGTRLLITITGKPPANDATLGVELCLNAGVDATVNLTK